MIPKYPDGLPCPLRNGYATNAVNKIRSTDMDNGRAVQRWEFEDAPLFVNVAWIFNEEQARLFVAWTNQVVKAGWFTIRLLTTMGFEDVTARFTGTPQRGQLTGKYLWNYEATLEIEFEPMLEDGWAEILPDYVLMADIFDRAVNVEWPDSPYQTYMDVFDFAANAEWPNN